MATGLGIRTKRIIFKRKTLDPKLVVKESTLSDAIAVHCQVTEFEPDYIEKNIADRTKGQSPLILIAFFEQTPAGYMIAYDEYHDGSLYCWMVGVIPKYRRHRLFSSLMAFFTEYAKKKGFSKIRIKTRNARREMLGYLVKNGFNFLRIEPGPTDLDHRILCEKKL